MGSNKRHIGFEKVQRKFYETTWKNTNPSHKHKPGVPGWKSYIPNSFFVKFLDKLTVLPGSKMLDLGCGAGRHTVYAAKKGFKAYGIDFSVDAIKKSKVYAKNLHLEHLTKFLVGDVRYLPFKDNYFDFINDSGCFNHLPPKDWKIYAAEVYRVLKHGGIYRLKAASYKARAVWGYNPLTKNRWVLQTYVENSVDKQKSFEDENWRLIWSRIFKPSIARRGIIFTVKSFLQFFGVFPSKLFTYLQINGQYKYYFKKEELEHIFKKFKIIKLSDRFISRKNRFYFMIAKKD